MDIPVSALTEYNYILRLTWELGQETREKIEEI